MKSQRINRYMCGCLLATVLLVSGCREDETIEELSPDSPVDASNITLSLSVSGELSTRTVLLGSENVQHVTYVQLYIFNGTGDNALCVASENIGWAAHFGNNPPKVTSTMTYRVKYAELVNGSPYTFLAVGLDDQSGSTYGFPAAIQVGNTTLSGAIATLTGSETSTWTSIRQSELFAGATVLTPNSYGTQGNVDLWRRVAGVMGWFTNIPSQISGTVVSSIRISLYAQQNKQVPLLQRSQTPVFKDYINSPLTSATGGQVLVEIPIPAGTLTSTVLSKGSYVLPVPAPKPVNASDYTLRIEMINGSGNVLYSSRVTLSDSDDTNSSTGNGTGIIDTEGVYRFPIVANRFYGIGTKDAPINLGTVTLRGTVIAKTVPYWEAIVEKNNSPSQK